MLHARNIESIPRRLPNIVKNHEEYENSGDTTKIKLT